jgi:hypothetical protein
LGLIPADIYNITSNKQQGETMLYLLVAACLIGLVGAELFQRFVEKI